MTVRAVSLSTTELISRSLTANLHPIDQVRRPVDGEHSSTITAELKRELPGGRKGEASRREPNVGHIHHERGIAADRRVIQVRHDGRIRPRMAALQVRQR